MKRIRPIILAGLLFPILLTLATGADRVMAQSSSDFNVPTDFPLTGDAWISSPQASASIVIDDVDAATCTGSSAFFNQCWLGLTLSAPSTITDWSLDISGATGQKLGIWFCDTVNEPGALGGAGCEGSDWAPVSAGSQSGGPFSNVIQIMIFFGGDGPSWSASITNLVINGNYDLIRPVSSADTLGELGSSTIINLDTSADANIYASLSGTISNVRFASDGWRFSLITNPGGPQIDYSKMASLFVANGDSVTAGCLAGYASTYHGESSGVVTSSFTFEEINFTGPNWHDWQEPDNLSAPCNAQNRTANCLNPNPNLDSDLSEWNVSGFTAPYSTTYDFGVDLYSGGAIDNLTALETPSTYYVTIAAQSSNSSSADLLVTLGDVSTTVTVSSGGAAQQFDIVTSEGMSPTTADFSPNQFRLTVKNSTPASGGLAPAKIKVSFVCLNAGDALIAPASCYFGSQAGAFASTDDWQKSGGATYNEPGLGQAGGSYTLPNGERIQKPVTINGLTDASVDYKFTIAYFSIVSGADASSEVTVDIRDHDTDDLIKSVGIISSNSLIDTLYAQDHTATFTMDAADSASGDLVVENTSSGSDVTAIKISRICLEPVDTNGIWPGYGNADTTAFGLFTEDCTACAFPTDFINVPAWIAWLGCLVRFLISCTIAIPLNAVLGWINNLVVGFGLFWRWVSLVVSTFAGWGALLAIRMFANLFVSIIPIANQILAYLAGLGIIQFARDLLVLAAMWSTAFIGALNSALSVLSAALGAASAVAGGLIAAFTSFIATAAGTETTSVIVPVCSDPENALYDMCLGFDVVNFVVNQIPAIGALAVVIGFQVVTARLFGLQDEIDQAVAHL